MTQGVVNTSTKKIKVVDANGNVIYVGGQDYKNIVIANTAKLMLQVADNNDSFDGIGTEEKPYHSKLRFQ